MKVRFTEGPESLLISTLGIEASRGEAVEVPAEVGAALVEQGWSEVKSSNKKESN